MSDSLDTNSGLTHSFCIDTSTETLLLMCKDVPVYDITSEKVIDSARVPGLLAKGSKFSDWAKLRHSSNTNVSARHIKNFIYRDVTRFEADILNRSLSLSDCYWIKRESESVVFEDISPYYKEYWETSDMDSKTTAKPTLYANGYRDKRWLSSISLYKSGCTIEISCAEVCVVLGVNCCSIVSVADNSGIIVINFTDTEVMLESCDMSGIITEDNITTDKILQTFGLDGFKMLLVDAIFGNGDRHSGNFGFLRDANTGEYLGMAPLYDFDHALDSDRESDVLTEEIVNLTKSNTEYRQIAISLLSNKKALSIHPVFEKRGISMLQKITEV